MGKAKKRARGTEDAAEEAEAKQRAPLDAGKGKSAQLDDPESDHDKAGEESESASEDYDVSTSEDENASEKEEDDEDEDEDDEDDKKDIDVDFDFFDPKPDDFHGVKSLMNTYLDDKPFAGISEFADLIIGQTSVGTIMRTSDNETPVGLITAINLHKKKSLGCITEITAYMLEKCLNADTKQKLSQALSGKKIALILNERLVNCPPQLAHPLTTALFDEIEWAKEDEPTEELRESYSFDQYLVLTRLFRDPKVVEGGAAGASASAPSKKKQKNAEPPADALVFIRPEDEVFHKLSTWSFTWNAERSQNASGDDLKPMRMVYLFDASKVPQGREKIKELVDIQ